MRASRYCAATMSSTETATPAAPGRIFFERVLLPYRSLPPRGFGS